MESRYSKNYLLTVSLLTLLFLISAEASSASAPSPYSQSPSSGPSTSESTLSSSSPSPAQSSSPSSSPSAWESIPSSSSPPPMQSTLYSNPPPLESPSQSPEPSIEMQSTQSPSSMVKSPSPSLNPSLQMQTSEISAPSASQNLLPPTPQAQPPPVTPQTMMDSPDGVVFTKTSTFSTRSSAGFKISAAVANNGAIQKICRHTDYPPLCQESISQFFNGKTDLMQVLAMVIKSSYAHTEIAIKFLDELASKPTTPPELASALEDCKENFGDALDNLQAASDAIEEDDIGTIQTMLSTALSDYRTCADGLTDGLPEIDTFGIQTDKLNNMVSNCLSIAELHK